MLKKFLQTTFIVLMVFYIGTIIFSHAIWPHYLVGLPVLYVLLLSISIYLFSEKTKNVFYGWIILIIIFVIIFKSFVIFQIFNNTQWEGDASVYKNQLAVLDYIYKQANGKSFKYVLYTPPVNDYTYQYLFKWYGFNKYGYSPKNDARLAYFIIESDPGYPDRPKWWLDARKTDGKIIKTFKARGGIIVQTRIH
jgi:hypothetical protein